MSLLFRAAMISRGVRLCASSTNLQRFKVNLIAPNGNSYRYKASLTLSSTLRRDYSSKVEIKAPESSKTETGEKELIYKGLLSKNILRIKIFSLSTSITAIALQPVIFMRAWEQATAYTIPLFGFIGFMAVVTPLLLHIVTKRYVLSVEYVSKDDKYIATIYNLFAQRKQIEFTPEDVTIPTVLGMFTSCAIKGKPMFLDLHNFTEPEHYARIMGYDKPLDLQVDINDKDEKQEYQDQKYSKKND